jgi:hypothetical protein
MKFIPIPVCPAMLISHAHAASRDRLRATLMAALDSQRDPRVLVKVRSSTATRL